MVAITAGGVSFPLFASSGSAAAPAYSFGTRHGTGFWIDDSLGGQAAYLVAAISGTSQISIGPSTGFQVLVGSLGFGSSIGAPDLTLFRDAANVLAQRNSTTAQQFNIYGTFTDTSNYRRAEITSGGMLLTGGGTGAVGASADFGTGTGNNGNVFININNTRMVSITGSAVLSTTDNVMDLGASGATRFKNLFLAGGITTGAAVLHTTTTALTNGAAASLGTLTNAPAAGNPTKWVPINDNGTTRYIPCW